jgi:hypothetical protein
MREMRFKNYLLEREDKEKIELASSIAAKMIQQLEVYYNNLFAIYFPLPKQVNDHEKFMEWRNSCRVYEQNPPKYSGRAFSIQNGTGKLRGEYLDTKIYIYDQEFNKLHSDLRNFYHFPYEYNLRISSLPSEKRKNSKIKKEAKVVHQKMMQIFESRKDDYLNTLFHEIIHLLDHDKLGQRFNRISDDSSDKLNRKVLGKELKIDAINKIYNKIYINNNMETNAWFLTKGRMALKNQFSNFQDLLNDFKSHFGNYWSIL